MLVISDLEVHSKYARAVSSQMTIPNIAHWAAKKGIGLVGTGDFTHPLWFREIEANLEEAGGGVYRLRTTDHGKKGNTVDSSQSTVDEPHFLLTSEVSSIFSQNQKTYRVHTLIFAPNLDVVAKINQELLRRGCNLMADGRPIIGLSCRQLAEVVLSVDEHCLLIPAHVWTPWFGFYGANGGFDSLQVGFGEYAKYIWAIETGMSSDPAMNWRIPELESRSIVSFGDAHSLTKLGREATVFEVPELSYDAIRKAIINKSTDYGLQTTAQNKKAVDGRQSTVDKARIAYTIEFYPEEGKYHLTGHRGCLVKHTPGETKKLGTVCPVCGKRLTVGVMHRVDELGAEAVELTSSTDKYGVRWIQHPAGARPPYVMLVPLLEILAEVLESGVASQKVLGEYNRLIENLGSEMDILLHTTLEDIQRVATARLAEAIAKVRSGDIFIDPGYDGVFGKVKIWPDDREQFAGPVQEGLF